MILVDTSVWVDHLRQSNAALAGLLKDGETACHPFVIGELACGNLRNRDELLAHLGALDSLPKAQDGEVLDLIGREALMGKGLGLIDVHLLASCLLGGAALWTRDKALQQAASQLDLAWQPT